MRIVMSDVWLTWTTLCLALDKALGWSLSKNVNNFLGMDDDHLPQKHIIWIEMNLFIAG